MFFPVLDYSGLCFEDYKNLTCWTFYINLIPGNWSKMLYYFFLLKCDYVPNNAQTINIYVVQT